MKKNLVRQRLQKLGVTEDDLIEKFILGTGSGGQKINKSSTCVYLCHIPTGIEIKCQEGRSREANREMARLELCHKLEERKLAQERARKAFQAKERRAKRKRSATQKLKLVETKRHKSKIKQLRKIPSD